MTNVDIPISLNDLQLARSALTDAKAEEKLFCRVYPRILRIVWLALGEGRQTEDVAQIAAMQVFKSLDSFRGLGTIEAWAERIAYRTAMKSLKKEKKKNAMFFSLKEKDGVHRETPEMTVSRRQLFEMLISKVKRIPDKRRIPLLLHVAYGYTVREVSALTETSPNTIKARLKKGYRELRAILDQNPNLLAVMEEDTL
jgi:RNA polymerase sigma-70 factor (ECF subfamily)